MGLFSFWKKKAEKKKLEELVNEYAELRTEYEFQKNHHAELLEFEKRKREEAEAKLREEEGKKTVLIHFYPGKELFVVIDGDIIHSDVFTEEQYNELKRLKGEKNITGIMNLLVPKKQELVKEVTPEDEIREDEQIHDTIDGVRALLDTGDFEVVGDTVRMIGIKRSIPQKLITKFLNLHLGDKKEEYMAMKNFWFWTCLNPIAKVADNLFGYLSRFDFKVNKNGFFYALRNVDKVEGKADVDLIQAISDNWTRIKGQKKGPRNFNLYSRLGDYKTVHVDKQPTDDNPYWEKIGNLQELYDNLENMEQNRFTDAHSGTFDIRIGKPVRMDPKECDWDSSNCSNRGLHGTLNLDYYMCGDTSILMLVNPAKVVGIGTNKFRCYEYLPLCVTDHKMVTKEMETGEFDTTAIENKYYEDEMATLEENVKNNHTPEGETYNLIKRDGKAIVSEEEVEAILEKLQDRVKTIF